MVELLLGTSELQNETPGCIAFDTRVTLEEVEFQTPVCGVWSNVTAEKHTSETIKERLVEQITDSVRWAESCAAMVTEYDGCSWHELAPSGVLRGLMRRIERNVKVQPHDEPS